MFRKLTHTKSVKNGTYVKKILQIKGNNHFLFSMKKILLNLSLETSSTIKLEVEEGVIQNVLMA